MLLNFAKCIPQFCFVAANIGTEHRAKLNREVERKQFVEKIQGLLMSGTCAPPFQHLLDRSHYDLENHWVLLALERRLHQSALTPPLLSIGCGQAFAQHWF